LLIILFVIFHNVTYTFRMILKFVIPLQKGIQD